jgi:hypothetical protein
VKILTKAQQLICNDLLNLCIENGFGHLYALGPIAAKHEITEILYDNNTNTGILWELGKHGNGLLDVSNDGETAGIPWECHGWVEREIARSARVEYVEKTKTFTL